jgi:hypothetical protein
MDLYKIEIDLSQDSEKGAEQIKRITIRFSKKT